MNRYSPAFSAVASPLRQTASRQVVRSRTTPASTSSRPMACGPEPAGHVDELLGGRVALVGRLEPEVLPPRHPGPGRRWPRAREAPPAAASSPPDSVALAGLRAVVRGSLPARIRDSVASAVLPVFALSVLLASVCWLLSSAATGYWLLSSLSRYSCSITAAAAASSRCLRTRQSRSRSASRLSASRLVRRSSCRTTVAAGQRAATRRRAPRAWAVCSFGVPSRRSGRPTTMAPIGSSSGSSRAMAASTSRAARCGIVVPRHGLDRARQRARRVAHREPDAPQPVVHAQDPHACWSVLSSGAVSKGPPGA